MDYPPVWRITEDKGLEFYCPTDQRWYQPTCPTMVERVVFSSSSPCPIGGIWSGQSEECAALMRRLIKEVRKKKVLRGFYGSKGRRMRAADQLETREMICW